MLQSVGVYLISVIDYYQALADKLAKTLTEIQNTFMHLKCTCSIMYSEQMHWYWQMCKNIIHTEAEHYTLKIMYKYTNT
jgi:uncharacterized protein YmfQ (DUF2313 family)